MRLTTSVPPPQLILHSPQSTPMSYLQTETMSTDELDKYYHKLTKKHSLMNSEILKCNSALRTLPLGQDRFRRQYWMLGHAGGVYVEGLNRKRRFIGQSSVLIIIFVSLFCLHFVSIVSLFCR